MIRTTAITLLAACTMSTHAQERIEANRPGFATGTGLVAPGRWQLETGVDYTRGKGSDRDWSLPVAEVRLGVASRAEIFVNGISWARQERDQGNNSGLQDMSGGVKLRLGDGAVSTALVASVNMPVGDKALSSDRWDPSLALAWSGNSFPLSGTLKASDFRSGYQVDNGVAWNFTPSANTAAFLEWEANLPEKGENTHWLNTGLQWFIGKRIQWDINAGLGLTDDTGDYRLGAGFAYAF